MQVDSHSMRIVYDMTILVNGYQKNGTRTGIVRVIEFLAQELSKNKEVRFHFCAIDNIFFVKSCLDFLRSSKKFNNIPFLFPDIFQTGIKKAELLNRFQNRLGKIGKTTVFDKGFRFLTFKILTYYQSKFISQKTVHPQKQSIKEIYHSPFLPLTNISSNNAECIKFITIYDMIPVLFPEFFSQETKIQLEKVYASIDENTWVLCISESTRNDLLKYKGDRIDPQKVFVTHLAASNYFYKSSDAILDRTVLEKYNIPNKPYVLALSILDPRKNMSMIIESYARLINKYEIGDLNLVLVGPSGFGVEGILKSISNQPELSHRIILTGFVADEDLAAIYTNALMFVYPSFYEGFGLPPLEAMQCGVPVITSNTSSLPEVVGDAAIMIDPQSANELEAAMYSLYTDQNLRYNLSAKGMERAKLFSWKKCAEKTIDVYRKACSLESI